MTDPGTPVEQCPACHGHDSEQVGEAATGFDTTIEGAHFYQPPYAIRMCKTCGLYFKTVTLTAAALDAYYAALDGAPFDVDADFPTDRVVQRYLRVLPDGSEVLDFGCSTGRILKDLTGRLSCVGVEPNAAAAAVARSRGIEIISADHLAAGARRFDAIVLTDVFEHLADPLPVLQMLASKLKDGGWLTIVTGNANAVPVDRRFAEFWYFRLPGHLIMAGQRHCEWLADRLGLELDDVNLCSHYRTTPRERLRQRVQAFAYRTFRDAPSSVTAAVLRRLPAISRAAEWSTAPALNYRDDHLVAFLSRPNR